ncbi:MAG: hypothetical protein E7324_10550 [Clostridiales bacterium]|nr:hypothetical protein [Clostridiales bacterium]
MKGMTFKRIMLLTALLAVTLSAVTGGTIAWFTDEVTSAQNTIQTGNLDMELEYSHDMTNWTTVQGASDLFKQDALWEPGHTEYVYLRLTNKGNLAAKYQLSINYDDEGDKLDKLKGVNAAGNEFFLPDFLSFGVADDITAAFQSRDEARAAVPNAQPLDEYTFIDSMTAQNQQKTMALVVFMPEDVGNEANHKTGTPAPQVDLTIELIATQMASESDAFDNQYDADATPPSANKLGNTALALEDEFLADKKLTVTVPKEAPNGQYSLALSNFGLKKNADGSEEITGKINLKLNDELVESLSGVTFDVAVDLGYFLENINITSGDDKVTFAKNYAIGDFAGDNNIFHFQTDNLGSLSISYMPMAEGLEIEAETTTYAAASEPEYRIVDGIFKEINPADYDLSLKAADSDYVAIGYKKNGIDHFAIGERKSTVIVAANDYEHDTLSGIEVKKNSSGKLYSIISGLQNNEYSHVFLLPGTYNEGTTIYIYSSMEIVGLGDTDAVKVVKLSSSSSNRHLFNATGTKADYIDVTLRDLSLDATAKTTNSKDNAAVQSIRKSKVKCYNLNITKGSGWDAVAFYVNGNNAVDGVTYPAYLYAENCTLNTTRTFGIVTTSGSYKFFHNGLTYGGTAYTNNSGSIQNKAMLDNDWDWD